jgi:hypothetical protein
MLEMLSIFINFIFTENLVHKYLQQTLASSNNYLSNVQLPPTRKWDLPVVKTM